MERTLLLRALAGQRAYCDGRSPLYSAILAGLQADADAEPPWLGAAERAWRGRPFAVGWEAAHLLLAGMHYWALGGGAPELAAVYPSCGGFGGDPGAAASAFLARAPRPFWRRLATARVQTNEIGRSVPWLLAAAAAFGARGLPFHLVELGASAGLNLVGDHLPHACRFSRKDGAPAQPPAGWDRRPHPVLSRTGLDLAPRSIARARDRLWLKACVWADDVERLARLDRAMRKFLEMRERPRLEPCAFADAPAWLLSNLKARLDEGLLVFNSIATVYLDAAAYAALKQGMTRALAPWGERAVWVEYERPRGEANGPLELRIHRSIGGALRTRILASGPPHAAALTLHEVTPWRLN